MSSYNILYASYLLNDALTHTGFILVLIGGVGSFTDAGYMLAYRVSLLAIIHLPGLFGNNPQDTRVLTKC